MKDLHTESHPHRLPLGSLASPSVGPAPAWFTRRELMQQDTFSPFLCWTFALCCLVLPSAPMLPSLLLPLMYAEGEEYMPLALWPRPAWHLAVSGKCRARLRVGTYLGGQLLPLRCGSSPASPSVGPASIISPDHLLSKREGLSRARMQLPGADRTQVHAGSVSPARLWARGLGPWHSRSRRWFRSLLCLNQLSGLLQP